jgi:hypothetical protein
MLGGWSKDSGPVNIRFFEHNGKGRLELPFDENSILAYISGNTYTLDPTIMRGAQYSFTAAVGANGKLTISGAKEIITEERNVSVFAGKSMAVTDLNGTYTKN